MEIVTDASVIIAVIANEPEKKELIEITERADLVAPSSLVLEIGTAFSAMVKKRRINAKQAVSSVRIFNKIPIRYLDIDLEQSLKIACRLNIYAYDAYYICCALKHKFPILSLDQTLSRAAQKAGVKTMEV